MFLILGAGNVFPHTLSWSIQLDAELPPKETLRRAIERLRNASPQLTLLERRKLASLRMNLRIIEGLCEHEALPDRVPGRAELTARHGDGDEPERR